VQHSDTVFGSGFDDVGYDLGYSCGLRLRVQVVLPAHLIGSARSLSSKHLS